MNSTLVSTAKDYRLGFQSLDREVEIPRLPVSGTLPSWLTGTLIRNGPCRFEVGSDAYRHWFDVLSMLHRFSISTGGVSYANRFLRSPAFLEAERTGHIVCPEFATDPKRGPLGRVVALFGTPESHNANVNIVPFGDTYLALTETPSPVAFDGVTLATRGVREYDDDVRGQVTTAHTIHDPARRASFNVVIEFGRTSTYKIVRIADGTLQRTVIASIAVDRPSYLHAFAMTERAIVLIEYPLVVNPIDLMLHSRPFIDTYRWMPERTTRFHVIDKDTGVVDAPFTAPACFAFHPVNAYDERDSIVLDLAAYDDAGIVSDFMLDRLRAAGPPTVAHGSLRRYRLISGHADATCEAISEATAELPRVATSRIGKPYTFAYGLDNAPGGGSLFDHIVKIDVRERTTASWSRPGASAGEPVFVPKPGATDEDDGVVLSVVLDAEAGSSYLLVLDARTLDECARALVPHHIPFGFHGLFR